MSAPAGLGTYVYPCLAGWEGDGATYTDTEECAVLSGAGACVNGATFDESCSDSAIAVAAYMYMCNCADGYEGTNGGTDTDDCSPHPCKDHDGMNAHCIYSTDGGVVAVDANLCGCPMG